MMAAFWSSGILFAKAVYYRLYMEVSCADVWEISAGLVWVFFCLGLICI